MEQESLSNTKLNKIILVISIIGIIGIIALVTADDEINNEVITHTQTTDTICNNGICNKILYSGIRNIYEDNEWKKIEEARSLKDKGFKIDYLEDDPDFTLKVIDFNYTDIEMIAMFTGNPSDYPDFCTVKTENVEFKCQFKNTIKWIDDDGIEQTIKYDLKYEMKDSIIVANDTKFSYKGNPFGNEFKFGGYSTTIKIQDNETGNLGDTYIDFTTPDSNYGDVSPIIANDTGKYIYIKFNLTEVPNDSEVIESLLTLTRGFSSTGSAVYVWNITNQTWDEDTPTWNSPLTLYDKIATYNIGGGDPTSGAININVTDYVSDAFPVNNLSFGINFTESIFSIYSKESSIISTRPYLNITYEEAPQTISNRVTILGGNKLSLASDGRLKIIA